MGRPKKYNIENIADEEMREIVRGLIAKEVSEYKKEIKELRGKLEEKPEPTEKKVAQKYKFIPDNTKIRVRNNIDGKFIFSDDRGKIRVFVNLPSYGDTIVLDYDEVRVLNNCKGNYFKTGTLVVEDVVSDIDLTIQDIYRDLRVEKIYNSKINPNNFEKLMSDDVSYKDFETYLMKNKDVAETVLIISCIMYRQGRFNDNAKMHFFKQEFRNPNLYS